MANQHGGLRTQRTKTQSKPVSGVGANSERTDMKPATQSPMPIPANGQYGDRKIFNDLQSSAPMAGNPAPIPAGPQVVDMFAPSQYQNEPVTAGSPLGAGPGPEILNLPTQTPSVRDTLQRLAAVDESGEIDTLINYLSQRGL